MESFVRAASNLIFRILCKFHLLYDSKFLTDYFDTIAGQVEKGERSKIEIENVANLNRARRQQQSRRRRRQLSFRWKLAFISNFILFRILFQTALWIFDSQISTRMQVLLLNPIAIAHFDSFMQMFLILYLVIARNWLPLMYVQNRGLTFHVLREAIVENGNSLFLESRFRFPNWIFRFLAGPDDLISKQLQSFSIWISNILKQIINTFHLENLSLIMAQLLEHNDHFTPFDYAIIWCSFTLNMFTIHIMFPILVLVVLNGILTAIVAYVRWTQIEHFVRRHFVFGRPRRKLFIDTVTFMRFPTAAFQRFRVLIVTGMHLLADANRIYGKAFFDFILTNVPLNSLLIGMLITGQFRGSIKLIVILIIVAQMQIMIVVQICAAVLCRRFHRPVIYFFRFVANPDSYSVCGASFAKHLAVVWHRKAFGLKPDYENLANNKHTKIAKIINGDKCEPQQQQQHQQHQR